MIFGATERNKKIVKQNTVVMMFVLLLANWRSLCSRFQQGKK